MYPAAIATELMIIVRIRAGILSGTSDCAFPVRTEHLRGQPYFRRTIKNTETESLVESGAVDLNVTYTRTQSPP